MDVGGNWLRSYQSASSEETPDQRRSRLARVIDVATRQGDTRGEETQAIVVLDAGLIRHHDAPPAVVFEALLYRAEFKARECASFQSDLIAANALLPEHDLGDHAAQALATTTDATKP